MWPNVITIDRPCSHSKRRRWPVSVARLMAGINHCRTGTVLGATAASSGGAVASCGHHSTACAPSVTCRSIGASGPQRWTRASMACVSGASALASSQLRVRFWSAVGLPIQGLKLKLFILQSGRSRAGGGGRHWMWAVRQQFKRPSWNCRLTAAAAELATTNPNCLSTDLLSSFTGERLRSRSHDQGGRRHYRSGRGPWSACQARAWISSSAAKPWASGSSGRSCRS